MTTTPLTHIPHDSGVPASARDFSVEGRVVIVTGAAQGIGRELARQFAAAGAVAVVADLAIDKAEAVVKEIHDAGGTGLAVKVNVADEPSVTAMVNTVIQTWGRIDVLINNASIFATLEKVPFDQIPLAQWENVLKVNITGTYLCARAVAAHMRQAGFGRIINVSSDAVTRGTVNYLHYVTSKSAVIGMTNSLARELGTLRHHRQLHPARQRRHRSRTHRQPHRRGPRTRRIPAVHPPRHGPHRPGRHHALPRHTGIRLHHRPDHRLRRRLHPQQLTQKHRQPQENPLMKQYPHLYIDGQWTEPAGSRVVELIDPTREEPFAQITLGTAADVDRAVAAAQKAFQTFSTTTVEERIALIDRIIDAYESRIDEFSELIAREEGIPVNNRAQVTGPAEHMRVARDILREYPFETRIGGAIVRREPIGVCALISPWNWPIQTGVIKLIYALAAGCTIVAKPSINSAASGALLAQVLHEAKVPAGVFNLVNGTGREVGDALSRHPGVDMISFTGSTGAGQQVGAAAAETVKRVSLELGGKSANIVLPDADLEKAARWNIQRAFFNAGQSCHAPTRMLVHESQIDQITPFLADEAQRFRLGDPLDSHHDHGPGRHRRPVQIHQGPDPKRHQ